MRIVITLLFFLTVSFGNILALNEAFKLKLNANEDFLSIDFDIANDVYLYKSVLRVKINDKDISKLLNLPQATDVNNEQRYYKKVNINIAMHLIKKEFQGDKHKIEIYYQGCSTSGYCYKPVSKHFILDMKTYELLDAAKQDEKKQNSFFDNKSSLFIILSFFVYGLMLSLSPCSLPMIPILSSIILVNKDKNTKIMNFALSFVYVFFMSLAYSLAGVLTSFIGSSIQAFLQKPLVLSIFALIFVFLSLVCFGVFKLQMPVFLQKFIGQKKGGSFITVALMGFFSVLIIGPCMVAPLAAALLYITSSADVVLGGLSLFALGFGSGIILLFVGLGISFIKPGEWMKKVNVFFGFLLLFMAIWLVSRFINEVVIQLSYSILAVFFVIFMGLFDKAKSFWQKILKAILILCLALALFTFLKTVSPFLYEDISYTLQGQNDDLNFKKLDKLEDIKELIRTSSKPVLLDFTASWCINCKLLDDKTFKDEEVKRVLREYELVKIDISDYNYEQNRIMQEFTVFAPPVLLLFVDGKEVLSVVGYISAKNLLTKLPTVLKP